MLPPIITELTLTQQFELERIKQAIPKMPRDDLEKLIIQILSQKMILDSNFKQLVKEALK